MNPIPIIGFSILGLIALHLAYKLGARKANNELNEKIVDGLEIIGNTPYVIDSNIGDISSLFVKHVSDLASKPKTAKPRKTTRSKN